MASNKKKAYCKKCGQPLDGFIKSVCPNCGAMSSTANALIYLGVIGAFVFLGVTLGWLLGDPAKTDRGGVGTLAIFLFFLFIFLLMLLLPLINVIRSRFRHRPATDDAGEWSIPMVATFDSLLDRLQPKERIINQIIEAQEGVIRAQFDHALRYSIDLFGKSKATLILTPKSIGEPIAQNLYATQPRVTFTLCVQSLPRIPIETQNWTSHGSRFDTGIYTLQIAFPPFCIACLADAEEYKIVEVAVQKGSFGGKWTVNADQDTADRIAKAALYDRYWIPLPYCRRHVGEWSELWLSYNKGARELELSFGNIHYAALFGYLNPLSGKYLSESALSKSRSFGLGCITSVGLLGLGVFLFVLGIRTFLSIGLYAGLILLGSAGIVMSFLCLRSGEETVPFDPDKHVKQAKAKHVLSGTTGTASMHYPQTAQNITNEAESALLHAAEYGDIDPVGALLNSGVHVDVVDREKSTALGNAAVGGHIRVMEVLLDRGANPNAQNKDGITPLMRAAGNGHLEAVKLLLSRGADPHVADREGLTALQYAEMLGRKEIAQVLRERMNL